MRGATSFRRALLTVLTAWAAPTGLSAQARESAAATTADLDEDGQATRLPPLPSGMTLAMVQQGDELFRGKGGCVPCHGLDGGGMPASGSNITAGLHFVPLHWGPIDSLIRVGVPEPTARTPVAMPGRGMASNLTDEESRRIAAYVWAISQVRGEPWTGGHRSHGSP